MALAVHGCETCKPHDDITILALIAERSRQEWLESVEGRLVYEGLASVLPAGPMKDQIAAALCDAEARVAARTALNR